MKRLLFLITCLFPFVLSAQTITQKLQKAFQQFETDEQLKHAISSLYVIDAATGKVVFDKNSQIGLAPASTQKIITSVTAFELLGKEYRYKTEIGFDGKLNNGILSGVLLFKGSGDPTLGSWRWSFTKDTFLMAEWLKKIRELGVTKIDGSVWFVYPATFQKKSIPDGWIWQDIGNYYGAASYPLNWKENQYELKLKSGSKIGDSVIILDPTGNYINELKSAGKGSGDNAYVYYDRVISGTIPVNESQFTISAASTDPVLDLCNDFSWYLNKSGISVDPREQFDPHTLESGIDPDEFHSISVSYSPSLDSIIYWLNKKSINLYAEALIKTFAYEKQGFGSTDSGVAIVKKFWKDKGLDEDELNIYDGSGLSPLNRVTTHAQVEILKYAKTKDWFSYFLNSLPEYNNITMKSGTISDVKGFCGYHNAKDGKEYIFSFLVNNYSGKTSPLVGKMYKVLDVLK